MNKNLLIISYSFPPSNIISARRFGDMVKYMEQNGVTPWVLTTNSNGNLPLNIDEKQIIRIGEHRQKKKKISEHTEANSFMLKSIKTFLKLTNLKFNTLDSLLISWYQEVLSNENKIKERLPKIDIILATFGPATSLWIGKKLSEKWKVPWIADYRDLGALQNNNNKISRKVDIKLEKYLLSSCSEITTVSKTSTKLMSDLHNKKTTVIYNGWDDIDKVINTESLNSNNDITKTPYLYYAGRFYEHRLDSIYILFKALQRIENIHIIFRSLGPENLEDLLMQKASELNISKQVFMREPCDYKQVNLEANNSYANIVFEDIKKDSIISKATIPGKLMQLMPFDSPIICIARSDSDMREILEDTKHGYIAETDEEIYQILNNLRNDLNRKYLDKESIKKYHKQNQSFKLCEIIKRCCK